MSEAAPGRRLWRPSAWEVVLVVLILAAGVWSSILSPYYLSLDQILYSTRQFLIPGLLALGLMVAIAALMYGIFKKKGWI